MYIELATSNQISHYVQNTPNLQNIPHLQGTGVPTEVGPCADFVLLIIENATHRRVQNKHTVFNHNLTQIDRGTLIRRVEDIDRCLPGEILIVVDNNASVNNNVKHYMMYVGNIEVNNHIINVIGTNGNLNIKINVPDDYHNSQAYRITANSFDDKGLFKYDSAGGNYSLFCIGYNLA